MANSASLKTKTDLALSKKNLVDKLNISVTCLEDVAGAERFFSEFSTRQNHLSYQKITGYIDVPVYELFESQNLEFPTHIDDMVFQAKLTHEHKKLRHAAVPYEHFASVMLAVLRSHPKFEHVARVCVTRWVGYTKRLEVLDSACDGERIANTMPKGYACFLRNDSSLLSVAADHQRMTSDSAFILENFRRSGEPPQRSIRRLHSAGLRAGISFPLSVAGRVAGFLFINASKPGTFDDITMGHAHSLLRLAHAAESFLIEQGAVPDADYRHMFQNELVIAHEIFHLEAFANCLNASLSKAYAVCPSVKISVTPGLRFLYSPKNVAYALTRIVQSFVGFGGLLDSISVRVTRQQNSIYFVVETEVFQNVDDCVIDNAVPAHHPLAGIAKMCGFELSLYAKGFSLKIDHDDPESNVDYSC